MALRNTILSIKNIIQMIKSVFHFLRKEGDRGWWRDLTKLKIKFQNTEKTNKRATASTD